MYHVYSEEDKQNYEKAQIASENGDKVKALKYYLKAAEAGIVPAMVACGNMYLEGEGCVKPNISKSMEWFKKAAEFENYTAMNNLGYIYEILEDYEEAFKWYEKSAKLDNVTAMMNLAGFYLNGLGTRKNKRMAKFWTDKAESFTDLKSIKEIAYYYSEAEAIEDHIEKAIEFYKKAVAMGDVDSMDELAHLYFEIEEYDLAEKLFFDAAWAGNTDAMTCLGIIWTNDYEDFDKAHYWLSKAVKGGNIYALKMMGDLYAKFKQYPKALRWYRKATHAGEFDAFEDIRKIKKLIQTSKTSYKLCLRKIN